MLIVNLLAAVVSPETDEANRSQKLCEDEVMESDKGKEVGNESGIRTPDNSKVRESDESSVGKKGAIDPKSSEGECE